MAVDVKRAPAMSDARKLRALRVSVLMLNVVKSPELLLGKKQRKELH